MPAVSEYQPPFDTLNSQERSTFRTLSGIVFNLAAPTPEMVNLGDIAHALAYSSRYNGHLPCYYSIAQHCVHVMEAATDAKALALMHDASEAYVGDVISPLKHMLGGYKEIEARVHTCIAARFGLPGDPETQRLVHDADMRVFAGECVSLRGWGPEHFATLVDPTLYERRFRGIDINAWTPAEAKVKFLRVAERLGIR